MSTYEDPNERLYTADLVIPSAVTTAAVMGQMAGAGGMSARMVRDFVNRSQQRHMQAGLSDATDLINLLAARHRASCNLVAARLINRGGLRGALHQACAGVAIQVANEAQRFLDDDGMSVDDVRL
jgi:hypothetical protein